MKRLLVICLCMVGCMAGTPPVPPPLNSPPGLDLAAQSTLIFYAANGVICTSVSVSPYQASTAKHCVKAADGHLITLLGLDGPHTVPMHQVSQDFDIATLAVDEPFKAWIPLSRTPPIIGEPVTSFGFGCDPSHTHLAEHEGRVLWYESTQIILKLGVCRGDSGGPVLRADGTLIGLTVAFSSEDHQALVVPANLAP